jgi:hypothetical protein
MSTNLSPGIPPRRIWRGVLSDAKIIGDAMGAVKRILA